MKTTTIQITSLTLLVVGNFMMSWESYLLLNLKKILSVYAPIKLFSEDVAVKKNVTRRKNIARVSKKMLNVGIGVGDAHISTMLDFNEMMFSILNNAIFCRCF